MVRAPKGGPHTFDSCADHMSTLALVAPLRTGRRGLQRVAFILVAMILVLTSMAITARVADALILEGTAIAGTLTYAGSTTAAGGGAALAGGATGVAGAGGAVAGGGAVAACVASIVCAVAVVVGAIVIGGLVYYAISDPNADSPATYYFWNLSAASANGTTTLTVETNCGYRPEANYYVSGDQSGPRFAGRDGVYVRNSKPGVAVYEFEVVTGAQSAKIFQPNCTGSNAVWNGTDGPQSSPRNDPARSFRTVTTCRDDFGGAANTAEVVWESVPFTEAQQAPLPGIKRADCPPGMAPYLVVIYKVMLATGALTFIDSLTINPGSKTDPCSLWAGVGKCDATIWKKKPNAGSPAGEEEYDQCGTSVAPKCDFTTETPTEGNDNWQCRFGNAIVAVAKCDPLKRPPGTTIDPGPLRPETPKPSPNPRPNPNPDPSGDPDPNPDPNPDPDPDPNPNPETPENPNPGPKNPPAPPIANPFQCAPSGWNLLNPVAYVYGMSCVLTWAFVPANPGGPFQDLWTQIKNKPPWSVAVGGWEGTTMIVDAYQNGSCNSNSSPNFAPQELADDGLKLQIPCDPESAVGPAYSIIYFISTMGVFGVTALRVWRMCERAFGGGEEG